MSYWKSILQDHTNLFYFAMTYAVLECMARAPSDTQFACLWCTRTKNHPLSCVWHWPTKFVSKGVHLLSKTLYCVSLKKWECFCVKFITTENQTWYYHPAWLWPLYQCHTVSSVIYNTVVQVCINASRKVIISNLTKLLSLKWLFFF